jgi:hypothetical protein
LTLRHITIELTNISSAIRKYIGSLTLFYTILPINK